MVHISHRGNLRGRERKSDHSNLGSCLYQLLAAVPLGPSEQTSTGAIEFAPSSMFECQNLPKVSTPLDRVIRTGARAPQSRW